MAHSLQLFVDRRNFRPEVRLGTITDTTTTTYLEAVLAELDAFESSAWWQTKIALLIPGETAVRATGRSVVQHEAH